MKKIYNFIRKHWKPIIFSLSLIIFVYVTRLLLQEKLYTFDEAVYKVVSYQQNDISTILFKFISFLCSTYFIIFALVIIMIFNKKRKISFYIVLNVLLCILLNQGVKLVFARTRPVDINLVIETGYSFPSGHSMVSLAFYGFYIYLVVHKKISFPKKILICSILAVLVFLIGISRIYLGVHYASDVLAGFALGMAYLILFIVAFHKDIKKLVHK